MRTIVIVCAVVLSFASLGGVAAAANKVDICHFQKQNDSWKLITVRASAVDAHLENHDDALPGGTTSQTSTVLDADCVEVVACPCGDAIALNEEFESIVNLEVVVTGCRIQEFTTDIFRGEGESFLDPFFGSTAFGSDEAGFFCAMGLRNRSGEFIYNSGTLTNLTRAEFDACREDVLALVNQVGCDQ